MIKDEQDLRLLSIFHYVVGGVTILFIPLPLFYVFLGTVILLLASSEANAEDDPTILGWFMLMIGLLMLALMLTIAVLVIITGRFINRRKRRTFCIVVAAVECAFQPFGVVLGIFTIIVLMRESVKELFQAQSSIQGGRE